VSSKRRRVVVDLRKNIDAIDRNILGELERDASISNKDLADAVGVAASTCFERVRKLERAGIIRGYHARIAPECTLARFEVWATIRLLDLPVATQEKVHNQIASSSFVVTKVQLTGAFDYLIRFSCDEAAQWRTFCGSLASMGVQVDRFSFAVVTSA
jgi:Lrp/AsnC family transcriptional regulator, leucine-responsive regulatory protein